MPEPVPFREANTTLLPPPGCVEPVDELPVHIGNTTDGYPRVVSCWRLTRPELEKLMETGVIWLIAIGTTHPPVYLDVNRPFVEPSPKQERA